MNMKNKGLTIMYKDTSSFAFGHFSAESMVKTDPQVSPTSSIPLPTQIASYLDRLGLTPAQRKFVESGIRDGMANKTSGVNETSKTSKIGQTGQVSNDADIPLFALMESALGALSDGEALSTRLILALPSTASHTRPDRWLRKQVVPAISRSPMASRPFVRSQRMMFGLLVASVKKWISKGFAHREPAPGQYYFP